ncbi:sporulation protein YabP [Treponema sp. R6D11]
MEKRIGEVGNIIIENREKTSITGVIDVLGFDEDAITLKTNLGGMTLLGRNFRINNLNVDTGDLTVDGVLDSLVYEDVEKKKGSLFAKMFK